MHETRQGRPVRPRVEPCRECRLRPARAADEYCSDACATQYERTEQAEPARESVEQQGETKGRVWINGMRINLQNSA